MPAAGLCAFSADVAIADEQMQPASGITNTVAGMDTNTWRTMPTTLQRFVWMAAMTDKNEIQLGEMALQKSDNSNIKSLVAFLETLKIRMSLL